MRHAISPSTRSVFSYLAVVSAATAVLHGCANAPASDALDQGEATNAELASESEATPSLDAQMQALLEEYPDAVQMDERSIGWDEGKIMMVLPDPDAPAEPSDSDVVEGEPEPGSPVVYAAVRGCPSGWYCVFEHANFGGKRLQFSDCTRNDLAGWGGGFRNRASSWVNNGPRTIQVMNDITAAPDPVLWTMPPNSTSSYVGESDNDRADYFQCAR